MRTDKGAYYISEQIVQMSALKCQHANVRRALDRSHLKLFSLSDAVIAAGVLLYDSSEEALYRYSATLHHKKTQQSQISDIVESRRLKWVGHVLLIDDSRNPKIISK